MLSLLGTLSSPDLLATLIVAVLIIPLGIVGAFSIATVYALLLHGASLYLLKKIYELSVGEDCTDEKSHLCKCAI